MEYRELTQVAMDVVEDESRADAAVKAVLGTLASHIDASRARRLAEVLPEPLTFEKLRGDQVNERPPISFGELCRQIQTELGLPPASAERLVMGILHVTRAAVGGDELKELVADGRSDWRAVIDRAADRPGAPEERPRGTEGP